MMLEHRYFLFLQWTVSSQKYYSRISQVKKTPHLRRCIIWTCPTLLHVDCAPNDTTAPLLLLRSALGFLQSSSSSWILGEGFVDKVATFLHSHSIDSNTINLIDSSHLSLGKKSGIETQWTWPHYWEFKTESGRFWLCRINLIIY